LIQPAAFFDSIVAYSTHAADFCNTIGPKADIRPSQPCHGWLINLKKDELVENEDVEPEIMAGAG